MSLVLQMRSERAKLNESIQALARLEGGGETLSAEQLSQFADLETQFNALTEKISRAEQAERIAAASAVPVGESAQGQNGPPATHISGPYTDPVPKGVRMAQMVRLLAAAQGNQQQAALMAQQGGYPTEVAMALNTVTPGAGGVLVPTNFSSEIIEALRPMSVVRKMGAMSLPLNNGNLTQPRITGNTVVTYIGSDTDIQITGMTFADTKLSAKKVAAIVPISNDLIAHAGVNPRIDNIVVNDLGVSMGLSEDLHFIRADGSGVLPKGMRYWAPAFNVLPAPAVVDITLEKIDLFCGGMMLRVETANVLMKGCGWLMHPRVLRWLQALRDGNGNKAYPEINEGLFKGYPVALSNQIPVNLGAGGDETEFYFVNFADMMIGEDMDLTISFSNEASYRDANGDMVSAFQRDQTLVKVIAKHDFGPRHVESIVVAINVKWGAGM